MTVNTLNVDVCPEKYAEEVIMYPVSDSDVPSKVRLDSASAEFALPSEVSILLLAGFDMVLNPSPWNPWSP